MLTEVWREILRVRNNNRKSSLWGEGKKRDWDDLFLNEGWWCHSWNYRTQEKQVVGGGRGGGAVESSFGLESFRC